MSLDKGILDEFSLEANELLDEAEDALLKIGQEENVKKIYDMVFRAFHSLKGSSGMLGFEELQRHMHLIEDYLQKSKADEDLFKSSVDYYLSGIDAARKILKGEVIQFVYEVYKEKKSAATDEVLKIKRKKILYLSNSTIKPLGQDILGFENALDFSLKFSNTEELKNQNLANEDYDVLITDLDLALLKSMMPSNKTKYPIVLIVDQVDPSSNLENIYQLLKKVDEKKRIDLTLRNALEARSGVDLFDRAKGLLMYMYSDLEEYLISKNKLDVQKTLNNEIRSFIKTYTR